MIHKTLFVWVAHAGGPVPASGWARLQIGALGVLLVSQLLIQTPTGVGWGIGETMIAAATGLWAVEVIVAKRVLAGVRSPVAAAARMGIGLVSWSASLATVALTVSAASARSSWAGSWSPACSDRLRGHLVRRPTARAG